MKKLSPTMENYLKTIYLMSGIDSTLHVSDIAAEMHLSKASVCRATDFLFEQGLIDKSKYRGFCLTEEGLQEAQLIANKFQIIKSFLVEVLEIDPLTADQDACSFEHNISIKSLASMQRILTES